MKKCKHNHECEQCVRESIAQKERELSELKKKLPYDRHITIIEKQYIPQYIPNYVPVPYYNPQYILSTQGTTSLASGSALTNLPMNTLRMNSIALAQ